MNFLSDVLTYIRRIIKASNNTNVPDSLLIDYINRFWIMDVDARIQLFDLKTTYQFQTVPGVDQYNMPLYDVQTETTVPNQQVGMYPVYQGFLGPCYIDGVSCSFSTQKNSFFTSYPNFLQMMSAVAVGDGSNKNYSFTLPLLGVNTFVPPNPPFNGILRGHIDIQGIIATNTNKDPPVVSNTVAQTLIPQIPVTSVLPAVYITAQDAEGNSMVVTDSGLFLQDNVNYGLMINPGNAPYGNKPCGPFDLVNNTINYFTGQCNVTFTAPVAAGVNINAQAYFFQTGIPRMILYYDNIITLRSPPDQQYLVQLEAYLSPAAFFASTQALPFAYMAEYIARGAARKYMSDVGDVEQIAFYEPLFREQEMLVWKRSQRQFTATRTQTIYQMPQSSGDNNYAGGQS